jgi:hypothetical protein
MVTLEHFAGVLVLLAVLAVFILIDILFLKLISRISKDIADDPDFERKMAARGWSKTRQSFARWLIKGLPKTIDRTIKWGNAIIVIGLIHILVLFFVYLHMS